MTIPSLPPFYLPGYPVQPLPDVVPFTARSGATFAEVFYGYKDYIDNVVVPGVNKNGVDLVAALNTIAVSVIEHGVDVSDQVMAIIAEDEDSTFRVLLDSIYAGKSVEQAVANAVQKVTSVETAVNDVLSIINSPNNGIKARVAAVELVIANRLSAASVLQTIKDEITAQALINPTTLAQGMGEAFVNRERKLTRPVTVYPNGTMGMWKDNNAPTAWFAANYSAGDFFTLAMETEFDSAVFPLGPNAVGNIEIAIMSTVSKGGTRTYAKVLSTGIVDASTLVVGGEGQTRLAFQNTSILPPGDYAVVVWCSTTTISLMHFLSNIAKGLTLGALSVQNAAGISDIVTNADVGGGRLVCVALVPKNQAVSGKWTAIGDSITQSIDWLTIANILVAEQYTIINRGIGGQITSEMLARFNEVIGDNPVGVSIFGGANDIARKIDPQVTIANLRGMVNRALNETNARIIVPTVLARGSVGSDATVAEMNASRATINTWIRSLRNPRIRVVDWSKALTINGDDATYNPVLFGDHVHPNEKGRRIMATFAARNM